MFAAVSVVAPDPDWVTVPVPLIVPAIVNDPACMKSTRPALVMVLAMLEPVTSFSQSLPELATLIVLSVGIDPALPSPTCSEPAVTEVGPVYVFAAFSVVAPDPDLA